VDLTCPKCKTATNATAQVRKRGRATKQGGPREGNYVVCAECVAICIVTPEMDLREVTRWELSELGVRDPEQYSLLVDVAKDFIEAKRRYAARLRMHLMG
jgi:hypothetical protein